MAATPSDDGGAEAAPLAAAADAPRSSTGACETPGPDAHETSIAASAATAAQRRIRAMWLLLLEALAALVILVLIVWWTMFSGRSRGEPPREPPP